MKIKSLFFASCVLTVALSIGSCGDGNGGSSKSESGIETSESSSKWNQDEAKRLSNLPTNDVTAADYEKMIEQVNYALDDAEQIGGIQELANKKMAEYARLTELVVKLNLLEYQDENFPDELRESLKQMNDRHSAICQEAL